MTEKRRQETEKKKTDKKKTEYKIKISKKTENKSATLRVALLFLTFKNKKLKRKEK